MVIKPFLKAFCFGQLINARENSSFFSVLYCYSISLVSIFPPLPSSPSPWEFILKIENFFSETITSGPKFAFLSKTHPPVPHCLGRALCDGLSLKGDFNSLNCPPHRVLSFLSSNYPVLCVLLHIDCLYQVVTLCAFPVSQLGTVTGKLSGHGREPNQPCCKVR